MKPQGVVRAEVSDGVYFHLEVEKDRHMLGKQVDDKVVEGKESEDLDLWTKRRRRQKQEERRARADKALFRLKKNPAVQQTGCTDRQ